MCALKELVEYNLGLNALLVPYVCRSNNFDPLLKKTLFSPLTSPRFVIQSPPMIRIINRLMIKSMVRIKRFNLSVILSPHFLFSLLHGFFKSRLFVCPDVIQPS